MVAIMVAISAKVFGWGTVNPIADIIIIAIFFYINWWFCVFLFDDFTGAMNSYKKKIVQSRAQTQFHSDWSASNRVASWIINSSKYAF